MKSPDLITHIEKLIEELTPTLIHIRRHLHQYPELGRHEHNTTVYISQQLDALNLAVTLHKNETGLWADMVNHPNQTFLALRSDIDALPIDEHNDLPYASKHKNVMHACGHDVHATVLIGVAIVLTHVKEHFNGNVRFIFQPAEEPTPGGALDIIRRRGLENVGSILSLHADPALPVGHIGIKHGNCLASNDTFDIRIHGVGGHAASPHKTIDPILIAAQLINALYHINRTIDPTMPAVLTVTQIHAGSADNIIPDEVKLGGTLRALDTETRKFQQQRLQQTVSYICDMHNARYDLTITEGAPALINDAALIDLVQASASELLGTDKIIIKNVMSMGSEDFAWYLQKVPGAYFYLGTRGRDGTHFELHHPRFDVDERAIAVGVKVLCWSAINYFRKK